MKTFLAASTLALALLATSCGGSIELSAAHPLGTFSEIDALLKVEKKMERSERKLREPECFSYDRWQALLHLEVYQYQEFAYNATGVKHWVLVAVDDAGEVQAIAGSFYSGNPTFTTVGSKSQGFVAGMWEQLLGREPTFTKKNRPGIDVDEYLTASLDTGAVEGIWEKLPAGGDASQRRSIWDMVLLWRPGGLKP